MALEAKFRVSLDGKDELSSFFTRGEQGARRFSSAVGAEFGRLGKDVAGFAASAKNVVLSLGGLGAGLGLASGARNVIELRDAIAGVGANAGLSKDQIASLRNEILSTGKATNQFGSDLTKGLNAFIAKTGDLEAARKNLELYGKTARAARSEVEDIANIGAELPKLGITDQATALSVLAKQADVGSVELRDLVSQGPRLLASFQSGGLRGELGLREGGALAQVFQKGTGSVDRTSTAVEAAFRDLIGHQDQLKDAGINVLDPQTHEARDRVQVLLDVVKRAGGREDYLRQVFGDEAFRGVQVLASEFRETGGFGTFEQFRDVEADSSLIDQKFETNSTTTSGRLRQLQIDLQEKFDQRLGDATDFLGDNAGLVGAGAGFALDHPILSLLGGLGARSAGRVGSQYLGGKLQGLLGGLFGSGGGGGEGAVGSEGQRVFVTNWPSGFGGGGGIGEAAGLGGRAGALLTGGAGAGSLALPLAAVAAGIGVQLAVLAEIGEDTETTGRKYLEAHKDLVEAESRQQAKARSEQEARREREAERLASAPDSSVNPTVGQFGGAISLDQVERAYQGQGAFTFSPGETVAKFGQQQALLRALATGAEAGLDDKALGEGDPETAHVLRSLRVAYPEFASANSSSERGSILRQIADANDAAATDAAIPQSLRRPADGGGEVPFTEQLAQQLKANLGVHLVINIDPQGTATVEGDTSTRSPRILVNRTSGAN
jgi:hypothetical protein